MTWDELSRVLYADSRTVIRLTSSLLVHEVSKFEIKKYTQKYKIKSAPRKFFLDCTKNSIG